MIKHTLPEVMQALREVVEERGENYVYQPPQTRDGDQPNCYYADPTTGAASCVVGRVIAKLEPELFKAVRAAESTAGQSWSAYDFGTETYSDKIDDYVMTPKLPFSDQAISLLATAQTVQDNFKEYREVLAAAEEKYAQHNPKWETQYNEE